MVLNAGKRNLEKSDTVSGDQRAPSYAIIVVMHIFFRRLGHTEYIEVTAEDRRRVDEHPRTYLKTKKTFKGLEGLLDAAAQVKVNGQGLMQLHQFAQESLRASEGSSGNLDLSAEELERMGFLPMERTMRTYFVSIVPEASKPESIRVRAKLQDPPPGVPPPIHERSFSQD